MLKNLEKTINLNEKSIEKLNKFKEMLIFWNKNFNITSITDEKEIEIKHFEDSLINEKYFFNNARVIEIGSGGGFPSIPLMCVREDLKFTLVESIGKKCTFLKEVIKELNLNAEVYNARAEDLAKKPQYRENFDIVTARAVAKLNTLAEYCLPFIKKGGLFIAYKGEKNELNEAKNAIKTLGGEVVFNKKYELSLNYGTRSVIVIKKVELTPSKYPRGNGKERNNPL